MQIKIYVKKDDLPELSEFLRTDIKFKHTIDYACDLAFDHTEHVDLYVEALIFYDDFVALQDMWMNFEERKKQN